MSQQGQRFRRRALRRGYKVDEVDEFLDRVEATLAGDPIGSPVGSRDVHDFVFRVRFGGYDEWQVDMHLDRVERQLAVLEEGGGMQPAEPAQLSSGRDPYGAAIEPGYPQHHGDFPQRHGDFPQPHADPMRSSREEMRSSREDEPTMVRPARAAASVPSPEPSRPHPGPTARPTSGAPVSGAAPSPGRAAPPESSRHPAPEGDDFTQKLPPVNEGYETSDFPPAASRRFEREGFRYEAEPNRHESSRHEHPRYEPEPSRHESRYEPEPARYEPEPSRYDPQPQRYESEPTGRFESGSPRFDAPRGSGYDTGRPAYGAEPRRYEPEPSRYEPEPPRYDPPGADPRGRGEPVDQRQGYDQHQESTGRFETGFEPGRHGKVDMTREIPAPDSPFTPDDLHHLDQARRTFQVRRFGSGYDPTQVNRLFDAIAATMSGRATVQVSDGELDPGQFSLVQGGLFEAEVDGALREVRDLFARRGIAR